MGEEEGTTDKSAMQNSQQFKKILHIKEVKCKSPLLRCGLHIVTSFRSQVWNGGKGRSFMVERPDFLTQVIRVNTNSDKSCLQCKHIVLYMTWWKWHFTSDLPPSPIMRKASGTPQLKDFLQNTWSLLLKLSKSSKI